MLLNGVSLHRELSTPTSYIPDVVDEKKRRDRNLELLRQHANDKDLLSPLVDSSHMWSYVFKIGICGAQVLQPFAKHLRHLDDWMEIGYGRDRDIGGCRWFVNLITGRLAKFFYADGMGDLLTIINCTVDELAKLHIIDRDDGARGFGFYELKYFIAEKCNEALHRMEPSYDDVYDIEIDEEKKKQNMTAPGNDDQEEATISVADDDKRVGVKETSSATTLDSAKSPDNQLMDTNSIKNKKRQQKRKLAKREPKTRLAAASATSIPKVAIVVDPKLITSNRYGILSK